MPDTFTFNTTVAVVAEESVIMDYTAWSQWSLQSNKYFCKTSHVDILIHWVGLYPFASNPRRHYTQSFSLSLDKYQRGGFKAVVIIPHNTFTGVFFLLNTLKTTLNITLLRGRRHAWKTHSIFSSMEDRIMVRYESNTM